MRVDLIVPESDNGIVAGRRVGLTVRVTHYETLAYATLYLDGEWFDELPAPPDVDCSTGCEFELGWQTPRLDEIVDEGSHQITVVIGDAFGYEGQASERVYLYDVPRVSVDAPDELVGVGWYDVETTVSDASGVELQFFVDNELLETDRSYRSNPGPGCQPSCYLLTRLDLRPLAEGAHEINVIAVDDFDHSANTSTSVILTDILYVSEIMVQGDWDPFSNLEVHLDLYDAATDVYLGSAPVPEVVMSEALYYPDAAFMRDSQTITAQELRNRELRVEVIEEDPFADDLIGLGPAFDVDSLDATEPMAFDSVSHLVLATGRPLSGD
ncbi:hypothetical protein [Haliangium sp.]|uniref:hypothetical protein n=1 Tax=Haliangium sp. TaxID=2663208 RepID=UPI003D0CE385